MLTRNHAPQNLHLLPENPISMKTPDSHIPFSRFMIERSRASATVFFSVSVQDFRENSDQLSPQLLLSCFISRSSFLESKNVVEMGARVALKRGSPRWTMWWMWWRAISGAARGEETQQHFSYGRVRDEEGDVKKTKTTGVGAPLDMTVRDFRRHVPIEEASTPPSAWYTDAAFAELEIHRVFGRGWQAVGHVNQVEKVGSFFTGSVGKVRYVVCRDEEGQLRSFHNVCRHHAAAVASGSGCTHSFVCPYHGWTYGLDGRLQKANRLAGIRNFSARENGLVPIRVATWGLFVVVSLAESKASEGSSTAEEGWLGSAGPALTSAGINSSLQHVATREYVMSCNWKVYCDNYLDGGYHVPHAHGSLATYLDLPSYSTSLLERVSIQRCRAAKKSGRVGNIANYAFVYPNFMINRYGPWMDTNLVLPISPSQCRVVFDWFLDSSLVHDKNFIESSIADSEVVQKEDIALCEDVQNGLSSPAYEVGRYAPRVEQAMHHFHCLLHDDLSS